MKTKLLAYTGPCPDGLTLHLPTGVIHAARGQAVRLPAPVAEQLLAAGEWSPPASAGGGGRQVLAHIDAQAAAPRRRARKA